MGDGGELFIQLLVQILFGVVTALIANRKGRNVAGWFCGGFLLGCIGLIIILCLSNLNEEEARFEAQDAQTRRLREQLRQEQMKLETMRQHTAARLDQHDEELGVNTRSLSPALPGAIQAPRPKLPSLTGETSGAPVDYDDSVKWYYISEDDQLGPVGRPEMLRKLANGYVSNQTMVWNEDMEAWTALSDVPDFQSNPGSPGSNIS